MPLILDTFNVLHTVGILPPDLAGLDVPGLAQLILRSRYASEKTTFACDGLPAADLPPQGPLDLLSDVQADAFMHVRYSGRASTADELIRQMVDASTAPRRLIIVSTDHAIQKHASRRRCVVLSSSEFLQHLADDADLPRPASPAPSRRPSAMSAEQIERWKDVFKIDDDVAAALTPPPPPSPALTSEAGVASASEGDSHRATIANARPSTSGTSPLPDDLIAQAEALWQGGTRRPTPPSPAAKTASMPQPPGVAEHVAPNAQSTPAGDGDVDLANLDMESILPQDGRTQRLRRNDHRNRPM